jgi:8-oxo-dGTP diphosphatase
MFEVHKFKTVDVRDMSIDELTELSSYQPRTSLNEYAETLIRERLANPVMGVAAVLYSGSEVLLQRRLKNPGAGLLVLPGGRLDEENPTAGIAREIEEELGYPMFWAMTQIHHIAHDKMGNGDPLIMLYFYAQFPKGSERNMEPEKCDGFEWHDWNSLPSNMWDNDRAAVESFKAIKQRIESIRIDDDHQ